MILFYSFGYQLLFMMKRLRKRYRFFDRSARAYEYYFGLLLNRKFRPWLENHPAKQGLNTKKRREIYIVSLTTFPARIDHVHIAIETLLRQSFKPDGIVLWLAESQFPGKKLPNALRDLEGRGLTIRWCEDLRSHKKYFYAFREYPNANILLADDDLFYPPDSLRRLIRLHRKYPDHICALSAQIIGPTLSSPPSVWPSQTPGQRYIGCREAQAFTGAGSLFPPNLLPEETFRAEKAMILAGTADDLWLKAMSLLAGIPTTVDYPQRGFPISIDIENNQTLFSMNAGLGSTNDTVWQTLVEEYKEAAACRFGNP